MEYNKVVRMTMSNSVRGLETSLRFFLTHLRTQCTLGIYFFDIPDHVPYYDLVRDLVPPKRLVLAH